MKVAIIGTGAFGYAIAAMLKKNNHEITMWTENEEKLEGLRAGTLEIIPGIKPIKGLSFTTSYAEALKEADIVFIMSAAKYVADVCQGMKPFITKEMHFCIGTKGIEQGSCRFVHQVFREHIKTNRYSVIAGATFAIDIVRNEPVAFSIASRAAETRDIVIKALASDTVKLRKSTDMVGIEVCSIRTVIAIGAGILNGLGYNDSTRSFLIVESMHDIKELIKGLGGKKKTILSYAGIGDLVMTCTSSVSRNYRYGELLGQKDFQGAKKYLENTTVEGYYTLKSIYTLLRRKKIKMPVIDLIYNIVMKEKDPELLVKFLINKE